MTSSSNMEVSCNMALIPNPSLIPKNNGDGHNSSTHEEEIDLETRREHEDQPVVEDGSVHGKKLGFHEEQARNPNEGTKPSWSSILGRQAVSKKSLPFYAPTIVEEIAFWFCRETLTRTWRLKNNFIMKQYGETMYSFKFMSDDDRKQVLEMGSLHIASQLFILRQWKLFVEAEFNDLKTIPVWVVMKRFPMELWDDEGFGRVVSTIGKPLFVDKLTESMTRTSYARVCVEIDTKCTYPDHATVVLDEQRTFKIPFEYNWKPQKCS
ncbi:Rna exonuclease, partial [Thalictrum thalictroides]